MQERALGQWDLCVLATYEIAGVDNDGGDWGYCRVRPSWKSNEWGDSVNIVKPPRERDSWYINVQAGGDVNAVKCEAICFNLGE